MPVGYRHLTLEDRCTIEGLLRSGWSVRGIAKELKRSAGTISRELSRNSEGRKSYRAAKAHKRAQGRRRKASEVPRKLTAQLWAVVREKLLLQWSPEQIAGWLGRQQALPKLGWRRICDLIWKDRQEGGYLYVCLRRAGRKRRKRAKPGEAGRGLIPGRVDISERPAVVEAKSRVGDWEADTIVGARHQGALVTLVERKSKLLLMREVTRKTARQVGDAIVALLTPFKDLALTLTMDNGKEFAGHREVAAALDAQVYFARPYHSWERGLNEHTNGLVRQYFAKGESLLGVDPEKVLRVTELLNGRPRKVLAYQTPAEVFLEAQRGLAANAVAG